MYHIYLAGPITGLTYQECISWREEFKELLADAMDSKDWRSEEVRCLSPMREKECLNGVGILDKDYPLFGPLSCARGIISRDFFDCSRADILVANLLNSTQVSIGTVMEIAWAYQKRTPTIVIMEKEGNCHEHPMLWETVSFRVETLKQAAYISTAVLWPHR
jgi:nucleoside 2-deoxyribosyltransferase